MTWVRVDDDFYDHPKFAAVGPLGIALWVAALAYCGRYLTDGRMSRAVVRRLLDFEMVRVDALDVADSLVKVGLWDRAGDGYEVHDYLDYQSSAEQVRERRAKNAVRVQRWRENRNGVGNGVTNAVSNGAGNGVGNRTHLHLKEPKNEELKNIRSTRLSTPAYFDEFWAAYPRRVAKRAALRRWATIVKNGVDPQVIVAGAKRYAKQVNGSDPQFIKQPDGWLLAGRWEDEPPTEPTYAMDGTPIRISDPDHPAPFWEN